MFACMDGCLYLWCRSPPHSSSGADSPPVPAAPPLWCVVGRGAWVDPAARETEWMVYGSKPFAAAAAAGPAYQSRSSRVRQMHPADPLCWNPSRKHFNISELFWIIFPSLDSWEGEKKKKKLASLEVAAEQSCHQVVLLYQCLPQATCTQACWTQTPWHTGEHQPEETAWALSHSSDTWHRERLGKNGSQIRKSVGCLLDWQQK